MVDIREKPESIQQEYKQVKYKFGIVHELVYETDLPKCLELSNAIDTNPYHLIFYMIARFYFFDNFKSPIVYYYGKQTSYLVEAALSLLPQRFQRHYEKESGVEYIEFPTCRYLRDSIEEPWIYLYIKHLYSHLLESVSQEKGKRIFISRRNANTRRFPIDTQLEDGLLKLGFHIYELETMSLIEQIQLFRSAEVVVGPHGAGLTWLVFCEENTRVCEICPDVPEKNHYVDISAKCDLQYSRFTSCSFHGEKEDFIFENEILLSYLNTLVE